MKNKKIKLLMASSFISLGLVSCSTSKDTSDTLKIEGVKLGYGVKWMEDIVSAFTTKTGIKVNFQAVDGQAGVEALQAKIKAGGDGTDIFFSRITDFYKLAYQGNFVDVSDVWTSKDEDGKSIEDRTEQCFIDANKIGDKYVSFS
ncbi:MAG: extracellular solute-binding protein, partial [Mollicutes bacterium]|nr:extracellular solute-binding protein [Mollicutes bacterium]